VQGSRWQRSRSPTGQVYSSGFLLSTTFPGARLLALSSGDSSPRVSCLHLGWPEKLQNSSTPHLLANLPPVPRHLRFLCRIMVRQGRAPSFPRRIDGRTASVGFTL